MRHVQKSLLMTNAASDVQSPRRFSIMGRSSLAPTAAAGESHSDVVDSIVNGIKAGDYRRRRTSVFVAAPDVNAIFESVQSKSRGQREANAE